MKIKSSLLAAFLAFGTCSTLTIALAATDEVDWRMPADWNCQASGTNNFVATSNGGLKQTASYGTIVCPIETNHRTSIHPEDGWALQEVWVRVQEKKTNTIAVTCSVRLRTTSGSSMYGPNRTVPDPSKSGPESIRFKKSSSTIPVDPSPAIDTAAFYYLLCTLGKDDVILGYRTRIAYRAD